MDPQITGSLIQASGMIIAALIPIYILKDRVAHHTGRDGSQRAVNLGALVSLFVAVLLGPWFALNGLKKALDVATLSISASPTGLSMRVPSALVTILKERVFIDGVQLDAMYMQINSDAVVAAFSDVVYGIVVFVVFSYAAERLEQ